MYQEYRDNTRPRLELYVRQAADRGVKGSCPKCMKVFMVAQVKVPQGQKRVVPVDSKLMSEEFLKMNPDGTTPFLVDNEAEGGIKYISDVSAIVEYINDLYPEPDMKVGFKGPATEAVDAFRPKFSAFMGNQDTDASAQKREIFENAMKDLNQFIQNSGHKFLLGESFTEADCGLVPILHNVRVATSHFKKVDLSGYEAISEYLRNADGQQLWQDIRPLDGDIIRSWDNIGCLQEE